MAERWAFLAPFGGFGGKRTRLTFFGLFSCIKYYRNLGGSKSEGRVLVTGIATLEKKNKPILHEEEGSEKYILVLTPNPGIEPSVIPSPMRGWL